MIIFLYDKYIALEFLNLTPENDPVLIFFFHTKLLYKIWQFSYFESQQQQKQQIIIKFFLQHKYYIIYSWYADFNGQNKADNYPNQSERIAFLQLKQKYSIQLQKIVVPTRVMDNIFLRLMNLKFLVISEISRITRNRVILFHSYSALILFNNSIK